MHIINYHSRAWKVPIFLFFGLKCHRESHKLQADMVIDGSKRKTMIICGIFRNNLVRTPNRERKISFRLCGNLKEKRGRQLDDWKFWRRRTPPASGAAITLCPCFFLSFSSFSRTLAAVPQPPACASTGSTRVIISRSESNTNPLQNTYIPSSQIILEFYKTEKATISTLRTTLRTTPRTKNIPTLFACQPLIGSGQRRRWRKRLDMLCCFGNGVGSSGASQDTPCGSMWSQILEVEPWNQNDRGHYFKLANGNWLWKKIW